MTQDAGEPQDYAATLNSAVNYSRIPARFSKNCTNQKNKSNV